MSDELSQFRLDPENPWPGLDSYREGAQAYFHGREAETDELFRLVQRERLGVLFGQSGLGKTSLVLAGLFPRLRGVNVLPVYLRLDTSESSPPFAAQITAAVLAQAAAARTEAPAAREGDSLWEYFHRRDADFWSPRNQLVEVLLVFDQLEELFTLGQRSEIQLSRRRVLLEQLADLIEARAPRRVVEALDAHPDQGLEWDFAATRCRILFSFREDYLPEFESLRTVIPSIMQNRMRLRRMRGDRARDAVLAAGGALIDADVAGMIVRFVAGAARDGGASTPLEELEVEPALLSLVCREVNLRRQAAGQNMIGADLVSGAEQDIIADYYERCVADAPLTVRHFIEDELLTEAGYRDAYALDDAVLAGVPREIVDRLVERRLLRLEERFGRLQIELTHDVLTAVVRDSRERRRIEEAERDTRLAEEEARRADERVRQALRQVWRARLTSAGLAVLGVLVLLLYNAAMNAQQAAETLRDETLRSQSQNLAKLARDLVDAGKLELGALVALEGLPRLGADRPLVPDLVGLFTDATGRLAEGEQNLLARYGSAVNALTVSSDGALLAVALADGGVEVYDFTGGGIDVGRPKARLQQAEGVLALAFSPDGRLLVSGGKDSSVTVWEVATAKKVLGVAGHADWVRSVAFSPDGRFLATGSDDKTVRVWDAGSGVAVYVLSGHEDWVRSVAFSPDGRWLASGSDDKTIRIWSFANGELASTLTGHEGFVLAVAFSPDGRLLASGSQDSTVRLWDPGTGAEQTRLSGRDGAIMSVAFSADGQWLGAGYYDGAVGRWNLATSQLSVEPGTVGADGATSYVVFAPGQPALISASADGTTRLWPLDAPEPGAGKDFGLEMAAGVAIAFSPRGTWLALGDDLGRVGVSNLETGTGWRLELGSSGGDQPKILAGEKADAGHGEGVSGGKPETAPTEGASGSKTETARAEKDPAILEVAFSGEEEWLAARNDLGRACLWPLAAERAPVCIDLSKRSRVSALAFAADQDLLITGHEDGSAQIWDLTGPEPQTAALLSPAQAQVQQEVAAVAVAGSVAAPVALTVGSDGVARYWPDPGHAGPTPLETSANVRHASFAQDGARILLGSEDGVTSILDSAQLGELASVVQDEAVEHAALNADGTRVVTVDAKARVRLWNVESGEAVLELGAGESTEPTLLGLSDDGERILFGSAPGQAALTGEGLTREVALPQFPKTTTGIRFGAGGDGIVVIDDQAQCHVWRVADGRMKRFEAPPLDCSERGYVMFAPDGRRVHLRESDGGSTIFDLGTGARVARLVFPEPEGAAGAHARLPGGFLESGETPIAVACERGRDCQAITTTTAGLVRLRAISTGAVELTLQGDWGSASAAALSPDGRLLATSGEDARVRVWDRATGAPVLNLEGHEDVVRALAFSPDSKRLASGSDDKNVRLWDLSTGAALAVLGGHEDWIRSVAFSADGMRLASASDDGTARVWDLASGKGAGVFGGFDDWVRSVAFSPDGRLLAAGSDDSTVRVWDLRGGTAPEVLRGHTSYVFAVAFDRNGRSIVSGGADGAVRIWSVTADGIREAGSIVHPEAVTALALSPDGAVLGVASQLRARTTDLAAGAPIAELVARVAQYGHERYVAFSPDGARIVVVGPDPQTAWVFDAASGAALHPLQGHTGRIVSVRFSPDGQSIATGAYDGTVRIWDAATGAERRALQLAADDAVKAVNVVAFSPDGALIAAGNDAGTVGIWPVPSTAGGQADTVTLLSHWSADEPRTEPGSRWITSLGFSTDGSRLISGASNGRAKIWDVKTRTEWRELDLSAGNGAMFGVVLHDGNRQLLSWTATGGAVKWDMEGHQVPVLPPGLPGRARNPRTLAAFSSDGRTLVSVGRPTESGSGPGDLWLRDAATGAGLARLDNGTTGVEQDKHVNGVAAAAFAGAGERVLAAGWNGHSSRLEIPAELNLPLGSLLAYRAGGLGRVPTLAEARENGLEDPGWNAQQTMPASADATLRCDALAAHPMDDTRRAPGVARQFLDGARAARYCQKAAAELQGKGADGPEFARMIFQWGRALDRVGDSTAAQERYRQAAESGHAQAQADLAFGMADARDADENQLREAFHWAETSAKQGNAGGMVEVAVSLRLGRGVTADPAAARDWFEGAAERGHPRANEQLADMLHKGEGGPADAEAALFRAALAARLWQGWGDVDSANTSARTRASLIEEIDPAKAGAILCRAQAWQPEARRAGELGLWERVLQTFERLWSNGDRGSTGAVALSCS